MTCKDNCLFAPLCKYNDGISEWSLSNCPLHKDRSRFIELPESASRVIVFDGNTKPILDKCIDEVKE